MKQSETQDMIQHFNCFYFVVILFLFQKKIFSFLIISNYKGRLFFIHAWELVNICVWVCVHNTVDAHNIFILKLLLFCFLSFSHKLDESKVHAACKQTSLPTHRYKPPALRFYSSSVVCRWNSAPAAHWCSSAANQRLTPWFRIS